MDVLAHRICPDFILTYSITSGSTTGKPANKGVPSLTVAGDRRGGMDLGR